MALVGAPRSHTGTQHRLLPQHNTSHLLTSTPPPADSLRVDLPESCTYSHAPRAVLANAVLAHPATEMLQTEVWTYRLEVTVSLFCNVAFQEVNDSKLKMHDFSGFPPMGLREM